MRKPERAEVIIVGGGLAGFSDAIYLGRAKRDTLLIDDGKSMARWEPHVENYLGFPGGIAGAELLRRARAQARRYRIRSHRDYIQWARAHRHHFTLRGRKGFYTCQQLLLATGIFHLPPDIPGVKACLGHSMFFCKDCDGYRIQGKAIAVYGWTNEAVEYALALLLYSSRVILVTDGRKSCWDRPHDRWIREYRVPVYPQAICNVRHEGHQIRALELNEGPEVPVEALFTMRGDVYFHHLATCLGAKVDEAGEIKVDHDMRTSVPRLYAAGCVTPANCQMIIAAGQGATAAQAAGRWTSLSKEQRPPGRLHPPGHQPLFIPREPRQPRVASVPPPSITDKVAIVQSAPPHAA